MLPGLSPEINVCSLWLREAMQDDNIHARLKKLRLEHGEFKQLMSDTQRGIPRAPVRCFLAVGPRGGIYGALMAYLDHGYVRVGVFVSTRYRRRGIGSKLVNAAQSYYAGRKFKATIWSDTSSRFWTHLGHQGKIPKAYLNKGVAFTALLSSSVAA